MADFVQTMKDWRRMCKAIGRDSCDGCKLHAAGNDCVAVYEGEMDYAQAEKVITEWAAEHPEPVYPTWWEYMCMIGVIPDSLGDKTLGDVTVYRLMSIKIPADIAEKLGIEPKEAR